jgi:uncharacterized protein YjbK
MRVSSVLRCEKPTGGFMPRDGIEREFKAMLSGTEERDRLLALIGGSIRVLAQRNLLFDTRARVLAAAGLSLRLRHESSAWWLTAKGTPREDGTGHPALLSARGEAERMVRPLMAMHLAAGTADPLPLLRGAEPAASALGLAAAIEHAAAGAPLLVVGEFRNERTLCATALPCGRPISVALDRSEMPDGTVEHELELEVARAEIMPAASWLEGLLARADIPLRPAQSKRQRFARALARRASPEARR